MTGAILTNRRIRAAGGTLVILSLGAALAWVAFNSLLVLNASWSAPHWGFVRLPTILYPSDPATGDWVLFDPPMERPWPYIKQVRGVEGDRITVGADRLVSVGGVPVGRAKTHSLAGRPVAPIGDGIIPAGHVFVFAPHRDSHDSRYAEIGLIPFEAIRAMAWPLPDIPLLGLEGSLVTAEAGNEGDAS